MFLRDAAQGIAKHQDPVSGLWWQVTDQPGRAGNYLEASGSAMFTYAFTRGVQRGWLDALVRLFGGEHLTGAHVEKQPGPRGNRRRSHLGKGEGRKNQQEQDDATQHDGVQKRKRCDYSHAAP